MLYTDCNETYNGASKNSNPSKEIKENFKAAQKLLVDQTIVATDVFTGAVVTNNTIMNNSTQVGYCS